MRNKRVLVTGGAGVIGCELVPLLVDAGATVLVGDLKPRPQEFPQEVGYRQGDLNDITRAEVEEFSPELIFHLAATFERTAETPSFWTENFQHNVRLSHHIMDVCRRLNSLDKVVFASSYLIYDQDLYQSATPPMAPIRLREDMPVSPRNLTGMAKFSHEMELTFLGQCPETSFDVLNVRIFRGFGRGSRDVISRWVRSALRGEDIEVYCADGMFDYIYAGDTAQGLLRLGAAPQATGLVNLGTGVAHRVSEVVDAIRGHLPGLKVRNVEHDIPFEASEADTAKLDELISWTPPTSLAAAIGHIVEHERRQLSSGRGRPERCEPNILVTSASRKISLIRAMSDALRRVGLGGSVIAADCDPAALSQHVSDDFWHMELLEDIDLSAFVQTCKELSIRMILPTRDGELTFWSDQADLLTSHGIEVMVSPSASLNMCQDKYLFAEFGQKQGLPFISTHLDLAAINDDRVVVKERWGSGSRGVLVDVDHVTAQHHADSLDAPIFQTFVPGEEVSIDGWMNSDYTPVGVVLRRREVVLQGESQVTTTYRNSNHEAIAMEVFRALKLKGPAVIQAIADGDQLHIIECNPRFGGASTASIRVGLDLLRWCVEQSLQPDRPLLPAFRRRSGEAKQIRIPHDLVIFSDSDL